MSFYEQLGRIYVAAGEKPDLEYLKGLIKAGKAPLILNAKVVDFE